MIDSWELKNIIETAMDDAMKKREMEIAKIMKASGESIEKIMLYTGLSKDKIDNL